MNPPSYGLALPEVALQNSVHVLVERPRGVVAGPVVVVAIRVGEEIAGQGREKAGFRMLFSLKYKSE